MQKPRKPTRKGIIQFGLFNLGGVLFFVVGYLTFVLLYGLLHWHWLLAKMLADLLGWSVNFVVQYYWAFRDEARTHTAHKVTIKFTAFSVVNLGIDYAIVGVLKWLGVSPFIGLFVAANFFTLWKWLWYKHWVFKGKNSTEGTPQA
jgi:putative flippase GtrA